MRKFLIVLVVIFVAIGFYYYYQNKTTPLVNKELVQETTSDTTTNWEALSQKEMRELGTEVGIYAPNDSVDMSFTKAVDLTGDGIKEGIIASDGPEASTYLILIKDKNGNIIITEKKDKMGVITKIKLSPYLGLGYKLLPEENGFYEEHYENGIENGTEICDDLSAYKWNQKSELFEWDQALTSKYKTEVCKKQ